MPVKKVMTPPVEEAQEVNAIIEEPEKKEKKEKKKRNINPETMTYIKALALWKKQSGHKGISPKKGSKEYDEVMKIMKEHKA
jgi:hypothetical protein